MNHVPDRALNPRTGDVWRREYQRENGEWYTSDERRVMLAQAGDTVARARIAWEPGPDAPSSYYGQGRAGRHTSLSSWRRWVRERFRRSAWMESPAVYAPARLILVVDGTALPPTRREIADMHLRLCEAGYFDVAEEVAMLMGRSWGKVPADRVRERMLKAEEALAGGPQLPGWLQ